MRKTILATVLIVAACVSVRAQDSRTWPPLLGKGNANSSNQTSPRYGISFNSRDFEFVSDKRLEKSRGYLRNHNMPHLIPELDSFGSAIRQPDQIGHWIDSAYESQRERGMRCPGKQGEAARNFNPRSLRVDIVARPFRFFHQGQWIWAGGSYDSRSRQIKVVNVAISGMDNPDTALLLKLPDWLVSEMSRVFGFTSDPSSPCSN